MTTTAALMTQIEHTMRAAEAFSVVLDLETAALRTSDFKTFETLQSEKLEKAQEYQDSIMYFDGKLAGLKTLPAGTKERVKAVHERFNSAAEANQKTLLGAKVVSERFVRLHMDAARASVAAEAPGYNARGRQGLSDKIPVHFKLNEVL